MLENYRDLKICCLANITAASFGSGNLKINESCAWEIISSLSHSDQAIFSELGKSKMHNFDMLVEDA